MGRGNEKAFNLGRVVGDRVALDDGGVNLSLIHISEPTRPY